jgi:hypothetical protein
MGHGSNKSVGIPFSGILKLGEEGNVKRKGVRKRTQKSTWPILVNYKNPAISSRTVSNTIEPVGEAERRPAVIPASCKRGAIRSKGKMDARLPMSGMTDGGRMPDNICRA